jgi:hypothetical protein
MRYLPEIAKARLRRIPWLYETVRRRRARRQEKEYLSLREMYYARSRPLFVNGDWLRRSRQLLQERWKGPREVKPALKDVRMFVAAADDTGGPRMLASLHDHFDAVIFDLRQFRRMGHAQEAGEAMRAIGQWRPRLQRELVDAFHSSHAQAPVDAVFAYGSHLDFEPETLQALRATGVPVLDLCLDDKHIFLEKKRYGHPNGQKALIGSVDVHLTNSPDCVRWYLGEGVPAYFMPQGVNPDVFRSLDVARDVDVSFVGQRYGMRARLLDLLRATGVRVECFGAGWGTRVISDDEKVEMYNRSRINLGVGGTGLSDLITCIKGRDFEVPACGAVYLTTFNAELMPLYDIGKEILCYYNEIDCVEVIRYYLERPKDLEAIGRAARERVLRDHTWEKRFAGLLQWMGILESANVEPGGSSGQPSGPVTMAGATRG